MGLTLTSVKSNRILILYMLIILILQLHAIYATPLALI